MSSALSLLLALQLASPTAGASTPAPTAVQNLPSRESAPDDPDKVVCKRTANTGSRVGGAKECLTKAQWREREVLNAQAMRDLQSRANQIRPN